MKKSPSYILISRTDSIGDVILTLPMAKILKDNFPGVKIGFLGKAYTRPVIECCVYVDEFIDIENFMQHTFTGAIPDVIIHVFPRKKIAKRAKQLKIPLRIGTTNRIYHWLTCNKLVKLSRKNSDLHETQLNLKLLQGLGIDREFSLEEIGNSYGFQKLQPLEERFSTLLKKNKYNLIIHPKSQGSSREWSLENFTSLMRALDPDHYEIFISGTSKERELLDPLFAIPQNNVHDLTGIMNFQQLMAFTKAADGFVANSTGPLHLAAALGKDALGLYPPRRSITPQRFKPIGPKAQYFVLDKKCDDCKGRNSFCHCIQEISPLQVKAALDKLL